MRKQNPELDRLREENAEIQNYRLSLDNIQSITGSREMSLRIGPDDFLHLNSEDLRMILSKMDLIIRYIRPTVGVPRQVKVWALLDVVEPKEE